MRMVISLCDEIFTYLRMSPIMDRKLFGPDPTAGKIIALWFRESRRCPRAPPDTPKWLIPLDL